MIRRFWKSTVLSPSRPDTTPLRHTSGGRMFRSLGLHSSCPARFSQFVERKLEKHFLAPVHEMFRYPLRSKKTETMFEFTIANNLLSVVSGLSALCYKPTRAPGDSGHRFRQVLLDHYPWSEEPSSPSTRDHWAAELYNTYRNPLAHALGVDKKGNRVEFLRTRVRSHGRLRGHSEKELEGMETSTRRPPWSATLKKDASRTILHLEGFYWGVRKLTEAVSASTVTYGHRGRLSSQENKLVGLPLELSQTI